MTVTTTMKDDNQTGDVDYTLQKIFRTRKQHNLQELKNNISTLVDKKAELNLAHKLLTDCTNQLLILQKSLEVYSKKAKNIINQLEKLENSLFNKDNKNDT